MKILILGNPYIEQDSLAIQISNRLDQETIEIKDSFQLLPHLTSNEPITIIDVVQNLKTPQLISINDLKNSSVLSAHDLDGGIAHVGDPPRYGGMDVSPQLVLRNLCKQVAHRHPVAHRHHRLCRRADVLPQRDRHPLRTIVRLIQRAGLVFPLSQPQARD